LESFVSSSTKTWTRRCIYGGVIWTLNPYRREGGVNAGTKEKKNEGGRFNKIARERGRAHAKCRGLRRRRSELDEADFRLLGETFEKRRKERVSESRVAKGKRPRKGIELTVEVLRSPLGLEAEELMSFPVSLLVLWGG